MYRLWSVAWIVTGLGITVVLGGCGGGEGSVSASHDGADLGVAIVGKWQAISATVDDQAVAIAEARGHDPSVDRVIVNIYADSALTEYAYAGPDLLVRESGTWAFSDSALTISWLEHTEAFDCAISGDYLTLTSDKDGGVIAVVWARI